MKFKTPLTLVNIGYVNKILKILPSIWEYDLSKKKGKFHHYYNLLNFARTFSLTTTTEDY